MNRIALLCVYLSLASMMVAADLSTAPSQELLTVYKQLRSIQASGNSAATENVILKRDAAVFTFIRGKLTFAAPIAGRILAAYFQGEGKFELTPPTPMNQRQLAVNTGAQKLEDTFREALFFFTDDTYEELSKMVQTQPGAIGNPKVFASPLKRYAEYFNSRLENQRKGYPALRNLSARMLADLTDPAGKGLFLADFKGKKSGDLLFHISWNRDPILLPHLAKGEEVLLLRLKPGEGYGWWAGFHLASEYGRTMYPDHRTLLAHCPNARIDLKIAEDNTISVTADMDYSVQSPIRLLPFNLNGVLRISAVEDGAGNPLSVIQEDRKLDSDPWVILPEPANPGTLYKIKIAYAESSTRDSRIISQLGAGLFYVTSRESWFPSFGAFDDRTHYELRASSPKRYKFAASGSLTSSSQEKDNLLTVWESELPLGVIGFNYGDFAEATQSTQNFTVTAYAGKELPRELKEFESAQTLYEMAGINIERKIQELSGKFDTAEREYWPPPATQVLSGGFNTAATVKDAAAISMQAFQLYEFLFGTLPFKAVSVTEQPIMDYGQSWPNLIFLPYDAFLDATTRNSLGMQDTGIAREYYNIIGAHEMAHQWWGHMVGCKTYHDQWLSEGIAEFASSQYLRQLQPKKVNNFWNMRRTWLLSNTAEGYRPVDAGPVWMGAQLFDGNDSILIYFKGVYIIEMLRTLLYDPKQQNPDTRFITMMHDFTKTFAGQNASTADFQKIVEKHIGKSMNWFFTQWVYGTAIPKYNFAYHILDAGDGQAQVGITIAQSGVPNSFQMALPLYAVVKGETKYVGLISVAGNGPIKTSIKLPIRPEKLLLDPGHSILAEIDQ
jgi:hypothetical protein